MKSKEDWIESKQIKPPHNNGSVIRSCGGVEKDAEVAVNKKLIGICRTGVGHFVDLQKIFRFDPTIAEVGKGVVHPIYKLIRAGLPKLDCPQIRTRVRNHKVARYKQCPGIDHREIRG